MSKKFVDCFMLMSTALSLKQGAKLPQMGRPLVLNEEMPTAVNLSLSLEEFQIIDSRKMDVQLVVMVNQKWVDPRLGANIETQKRAVAGQIWKPLIINKNGKNSAKPDTIFWRGYGNEGNVLYSEKYSLTTTCTNYFRKFPFDRQICQFKFGSYRFPLEEVQINWDVIEVFSDLNFNEFTLYNISNFVEIDIRVTGNFSVGVIQITVERVGTHYISCTMLPCFILTIINYLSLFFDLNKRNSRLQLNTFVFFIILYLNLQSICFTVPTAYLKALDIFVIICKLFALILLLQSLLIDNLCNVEDKEYNLMQKACKKKYCKRIYWLELIMKISYPVFYVFSLLLFGFVYVE